jgi:hypothetical protein
MRTAQKPRELPMRNLMFAALALLAGCGGSYRDPYYRPTSTPYQGTPGPLPVGTTFIIDANAAIELPQTTLGITTNGRAWILAWQGDAYPHQFQGSITCPVGCQFEYARFDNAYPGDSAQLTALNQIAFQGVSNAAVPQSLLFSANAQPITFDLYIDGQPAIADVVFPSEGRLATTDVMPFSLQSDNAAFSGTVKRAPEFVAKPPKDGQAESIVTISPPKAEQNTQANQTGSASTK